MHKYFAKTQFLGKRVFFLPQCHSTNDEAANYAKENPDFPEGTTFITAHQTNGRGQRGNQWLSRPGANATFSILLKPNFISVNQQFNLNIIISLGIHKGLRSIFSTELKIKWPNDLYFANKKIGGILIENSIQGQSIEHSTVGIGLNVNQTSFDFDTAASIKSLTGQSIEPNEVIENIIKATEEVYAIAKAKGMNDLREEYLSVLFRLNESSQFQTPHKTFEGKITGITPPGQLLIKDKTTTTAYNLKEVGIII